MTKAVEFKLGCLVSSAALVLLLLPSEGYADSARERSMRDTSSVANLEFVQETEDWVLIGHSGDWTAPKRLRVRGLSAVRIETRASGSAVAVFSYRSSPASKKHTLSLSQGAQFEGLSIVAVLPRSGIVLVEYHGRLSYLVARPGAAIPEISMAWVSPWAINPYHRPLVTNAASGNSRPPQHRYGRKHSMIR